VTTPVPSASVGPLHRSLIEALESVAAREQVRSLLRTALLAGGLEVVPEDAVSFRSFVEGPLMIGIERTLGASAAESVMEHMIHVLAMIAPTIRKRATGTGDDEDEPSGERFVDTLPSMKRAGFAPTLEAPILFPPRATAHESGTQRKRQIARVSHPSLETRTTLEVQAPKSGPRAVATDVLVISLDPRLASEVADRLRGRSRIEPIVTIEELRAALPKLAGQRVAVVFDTAVPSIDLPTFASVASSLPPGTHVVLWGTDERQKRRMTELFPETRPWVASGAAESAVDLLLDE